MKGCSQALTCSPKETSLRANYTKLCVDERSESPMCSVCGAKADTISHLVSVYSKLPQSEHTKRHDNVARYVHW